MTLATLPAFLAAHPAAILVEVVEAKGSTPREASTDITTLAWYSPGARSNSRVARRPRAA